MSNAHLSDATPCKPTLEPLPEVNTYLSKILVRGRTAAAAGDWQQAVAIYERALDELRDDQGAEHIDSQVLQVELAELLEAEQQLEQAEAYHRLALNTVTKTKGDGHPNTFFPHNKLANFYIRHGRFEDALAELSLARQAIGIRSHKMCLPMLATTWVRLAMALEMHQQAEKYARQAITLWSQVVGKKHPYIARIMASFGAMRHQQGRNEEAAHWYFRAADMSRDFYGNGHNETTMYLKCVKTVIPDQSLSPKTASLHADLDDLFAVEQMAKERDENNWPEFPEMKDPLISPAGQLGYKVALDLLDSSDGKPFLLKALTKRYSHLLPDATNRKIAHDDLPNLLHQMAYCWSQEVWKVLKSDNEWLEIAEHRKDFLRSFVFFYYLSANDEAQQWLSEMGIRESALNPLPH